MPIKLLLINKMNNAIQIIIALVLILVLTYKPRETYTHYAAIQLADPNVWKKYPKNTIGGVIVKK